MHCQNCGAENDPDARFCTECNAPLESQISTQPLNDDDADNDQTILSVPAPNLESAAETAADEGDGDDGDATEVVTDPEPDPSSEDLPPEPEPVETTPPPAVPTGTPVNGDSLFNQRNIIIAVIVLIVLCCCCFALSVGAGIVSGTFEEIQRELSMNASSLMLG